MEPTDLKPDSPEDAQLEAWLRANSAATPLPDDGFSRRVLAALPPDAVNVTHRLLVCVAGALVGTIIAFAQTPSGAGVVQGWRDLQPNLVPTLQALAMPSMLFAVLVTGASLTFAFWPTPPART